MTQTPTDFETLSSDTLLLGEGLCWDHARGRLWCVDIQGRAVHGWDPDTGTFHRWPTAQRVGWVIPVADSEDMLVGFQGGMARVSFGADGTYTSTWIAKPFPDGSPLRLNDAKADSTGAVWAGSLNNDDEERPEGKLFRLATDGSLTEQDTDYLVANGPAILPGEQTMLHTDSGRRVIYGFDLDVAAGRLTNKRVWKTLVGEEGYPDGMCADAEGCVWVAHWGGYCVSRFAPDGALLRRVTLPAPFVTNVCFGGPSLDRLFVTTASVRLDEEGRARYPLAGRVFEIDPQGVTGLPALPYRPGS